MNDSARPVTASLALLFGLVASASSVIFIKLSKLDPVLLSAARLWIAVLVVAPLFLRDLKKHRAYFDQAWKRTLWPGILLGLHFIAWLTGARMTPAVNSTLLVNLVPLVTPFILFTLAHERVRPKEVLATLLAMLGVLWLGGSDLNANKEHLLGDGVCFIAMLLLAFYLVLGRANRDFPALWLYMAPLYFFAALTCSAASALTTDFRTQPYVIQELWYALALGIIPTVFGHGSVGYALRHLRGQVVSIANLSQVVLGGLLAYLILNEIPRAAFYPASALVSLGVVVGLWRRPRATPLELEP
jgi:drug/metabolite transporter (DMT)-like permease